MDLSRRYPEVWKAMEACVDSGRTRAIGTNLHLLRNLRAQRSQDSRTSTSSRPNGFSPRQGSAQRSIKSSCIRKSPIASSKTQNRWPTNASSSRYLPPPELLAVCQKEGIQVTAHQPLGGRPIAAVSPKAGSPGPLQDQRVSLSGSHRAPN